MNHDALECPHHGLTAALKYEALEFGDTYPNSRIGGHSTTISCLII